ncbi:MAG: sulfatase-like hydrolase/transferase [Akkermansiaceae bacterium]|nr:sulfatase-like hydrolase/transferase [Akkermansiaceae bacterium]MDP4779400.1 sulfatase-like hydrolase/transferase [Akkermansiaceae bacterium]MDP4897077.1 sulfatase-like hydrolase/transferase [Akkermansiaceae bacterium]
MIPRPLLLLAAASMAIHAAPRPNIVFILTDDQRKDSLPCYGDTFVKTPEIDKLAAEGVVFDNATVTSAICTPSRACYFLGQYERRHSINFNSGTTMAPEAWEKSYPVLLRESGYYTGYVGKNHVPIGSQGYESGIMEKSFDFWYAGHGHLSFYPKNVHEIFNNNPADTQVEVVTEGALSFLKNDGSYIDGALSFLKSRPADKPFCLSICLNVPHGAGTLSMKMLPTDPELYRTGYRDEMDQIKFPSTYIAKADIETPKLPEDVLYTQYRQDIYDNSDNDPDLRELMVREYETITGIDQMIGHIRDSLKASNLDDNTIIIVTSDHGLLHGDHGLGGKALNYAACLDVPLIVLDPRLPAARHGARISELVQSIDLAPTLLDLAVAPPADTMQGESYLRLIHGEPAPDWRTFAFAENLWSTLFGNPRIETVRNSRWKYNRYFKNDHTPWENIADEDKYKVSPDQANRYNDWLTSTIRGEQPVYEELFDLESDPFENVNLASKTEHAEILEILRQECRRMVAVAKGPADQHPATLPLPRNAKPR